MELIKEEEMKIWRGVLRPVKGQEQAEFGLSKYRHVSRTVLFFTVELEVESQIAEQSRAIIKNVYSDSFIGKKLVRDIEAKTHQMVDEQGGLVRLMKGRFVALPLGGKYDIHALNKQGQPILNTSTQQPIIVQNRTTESEWLFADESIGDATARLQTRVEKNTGPGKRYQKVVSQSAEDQDIDAINNSAPMP